MGAAGDQKGALHACWQLQSELIIQLDRITGKGSAPRAGGHRPRIPIHHRSWRFYERFGKAYLWARLFSDQGEKV